MMLGIGDWAATIRSLGESFLEVLHAEVGALKADLRTSARLVVKAVGLFAFAFLLLYWFVGIVLAALVALLGKSIGYWQAAFIVAAVLLVLAVLLWLWGRSVLGTVQGPKETAQARLDDHVAWVKEELTTPDPKAEESDESG